MGEMEGKYWGRQGEPSLSWDVGVAGVCVRSGKGNMLHYTHLKPKLGE